MVTLRGIEDLSSPHQCLPSGRCELLALDHTTKLDDTYAAIWNEWIPASGKTPAEAPGFQRHNPTLDPRTDNGGVTIWIPLAAQGTGHATNASPLSDRNARSGITRSRRRRRS